MEKEEEKRGDATLRGGKSGAGGPRRKLNKGRHQMPQRRVKVAFMGLLDAGNGGKGRLHS